MTYHIEPVENAGKPVKIDWLIELEVGDGLARSIATITDLTKSKTTPTSKGTLAYRGAKTLTLPLDEPPTTETAFEVADGIAMALLEARKSKPSDLVVVVLHKNLTWATACQKPLWQSLFRYVPGKPATPWWTNTPIQ